MSIAGMIGQGLVILIVTSVALCGILRMTERRRKSLLERYRESHQP